MTSERAITISGTTAAEIAGQVRDLVAAGELAPGASLPRSGSSPSPSE